MVDEVEPVDAKKMSDDVRMVITLRFGKVTPAQQSNWDHHFKAEYEVQHAHISFLLFVGYQVIPSHMSGPP